MPGTPLVSIVCISMNHEKFIKKSFLSAIRQTYPNTEILYVDNNSSDASFEIADEIFSASGLAYEGIKRESSFNLSSNINVALSGARGKYVTFLSADDWWKPTNLQEKIDYYERHPQYGLLYGSCYIHYYDTGKTIKENSSSYSGWALKEVVKRNFVNAIGVIIKKETLDTVGLFDENSPIEDWDMWIRIAEKYEIGFFDKPLVYYGRQTGSNISDNKAYMKNGNEYIFKKYAKYTKEIASARHFYKLANIYDTATENPNLDNFLQLLKNFQFTVGHFKHLVKCTLGIFNIKIKPAK